MKSGKLCNTGLVLIAISAFLYACWGICAGILVQGRSPVNENVIMTGFSYFAPIFSWPTLVSALLGIALLIWGILTGGGKEHGP